MRKFATLIILSALVFSSTGVPAAEANEGCASVGSLDLGTINAGVSICDGAQVLVSLPDGSSVPVPPAGLELVQSELLSDGTESSLKVFQSDTNEVGVEYLGEEFGTMPTSSNLVQSTTTASVNLSALPLGCSYNPYALLGAKWKSTHNWYYFSANQPNTGALTAIRSGLNTWRSGTNVCTGGPYSSTFPSGYLGTTSSVPSGTGSSCGSSDAKNVIGFRTLNSPALALTCSYMNPSTGSMLESDLTFSTNITWFTSSATTGCPVGNYDLQAVATHEIGHVAGLDHVPSGNGQVMQATMGTCAISMRNIFWGDITGILTLYP